MIHDLKTDASASLVETIVMMATTPFFNFYPTGKRFFMGDKRITPLAASEPYGFYTRDMPETREFLTSIGFSLDTTDEPIKRVRGFSSIYRKACRDFPSCIEVQLVALHDSK